MSSLCTVIVTGHQQAGFPERFSIEIFTEVPLDSQNARFGLFLEFQVLLTSGSRERICGRRSVLLGLNKVSCLCGSVRMRL